MACLGLHLFLIVAVCLRDTFSVFATTPTIFPRRLTKFWTDAERTASTALGARLPVSNPIKNAITAYLHAVGIEAGYGFFAPNVPDDYKLIFELRYSNGRVEYEIPRVSSRAAGLRLSGLLDQIADTDYPPLREMMIKMLTYSAWQDHPTATSIRSLFGIANLPAPEVFAKGEKGSYQLLYAYDFSFGEKNAPLEAP